MSDQSGGYPGAPPGWYPDPAGGPGQRWWDGYAWTDATVLPQQPPPPPWAAAAPPIGPPAQTAPWAVASGRLLAHTATQRVDQERVVSGTACLRESVVEGPAADRELEHAGVRRFDPVERAKRRRVVRLPRLRSGMRAYRDAALRMNRGGDVLDRAAPLDGVIDADGRDVESDAGYLVAYRDDREYEAQPIAFEGDAWRNFVPVRLPWTLTVKDRAPRGVSAVLINPSHMYPDLALFIDAAQERVLKAIDGERSAGAILQSAAMSDEEGRQFFKRLWEHDLIVFGARGGSL